MATAERFFSPIADARYAFLIDPRPQLDETKPLAWSCQLVWPVGSADYEPMMEAMLRAYADAWGKRAPNPDGLPIRPDNKDQGLMVARFKSTQGVRDDGSHWPGPKIVDSMKRDWRGEQIGNGSRLRIAYKHHPWENPRGCGLTLIPTAVQVVKWVPYLADGGVDGFDEIEPEASDVDWDAADGEVDL